MKKVLVTGANGQLGQELLGSAPPGIELIAAGRNELDLSDLKAIKAFIKDCQPDVIINAAAYTAVDKAEEDAGSADVINHLAVAELAKAAGESCYFLHISTDFVFDGSKNTPLSEGDVVGPLSVYGQTKLDGENALFGIKPTDSAVIRTSWVYSSHGKNFVNSMLRFMAERDALKIVVDQLGTPTWTKGLAEVCWTVCGHRLSGLYHWSDAGVASWYDFASAVMRLGVEKGILQKPISLCPIPTDEYPLPARRPSYSVMDKRKLLKELPELESIHWQERLALMFDEYEIES